LEKSSCVGDEVQREVGTRDERAGPDTTRAYAKPLVRSESCGDFRFSLVLSVHRVFIHASPVESLNSSMQAPSSLLHAFILCFLGGFCWSSTHVCHTILILQCSFFIFHDVQVPRLTPHRHMNSTGLRSTFHAVAYHNMNSEI